MRTKVTLILVFLNVVLFFFIFGFERTWTTDDAAREARRRVLGTEAANIQFLELSGPSLPAPIRLRRNGEDWQLISPYQWPANSFAVNRIVNELQLLEHETSFPVANLGENERSLENYGLAEPALKVSFSSSVDPASDSSTALTSLAIGKKSDIGNRLYLLSPDGQQVHVVKQSAAESLYLGLNQLRSPNCFTVKIFEVRSFNLQHAGPANVRVRLHLVGDRWSFESPFVARASKAETQRAIGRLAKLETGQFFGSSAAQPDLVAAAGTTTPNLRITLEGNNRRETLLLGNELSPPPNPPKNDQPSREFYAQMENYDAIFTVKIPDDLANALNNAQIALRDPHVLDLEGRQIDALTLADSEGREVVLQRLDLVAGTPTSSPDVWQVIQRGSDGTLRPQPADSAVVVDQLLSNLILLERIKFESDVPTPTELEAWGLTRPERRITIAFRSEPGAPPAPSNVTLLIGTNQDGSTTYAKQANLPFIYTVPSSILEATVVDPLHYRQRLLRELPPAPGARLTGITVRDLRENKTYYEHDLADGETWESVFATEPPPRQTALTHLRAELRTLRAQRFVTDRFTERVEVNGEERGWRYQIKAKLSLSADGTDQVKDSILFFGERDGGDRQLVGSPEFNVVFEAQQPLLEAMWTLTYGRRDPGPVTLTTPPATDDTPIIENDEPAAPPAVAPEP